MTENEVDPIGFGKAVRDYAKYRAGFPPELLDRLQNFEIGKPEQIIVDLGTGTGTLARQFADRRCFVTGIDPDPRMLAQAQTLAENDGLTIQFSEGSAEDTGLEPDVADVVVAGQCWHWFDGPRAMQEVARILAPDSGKLVICHFDWIPIPGNVVHATEQLILQHNPQWHLAGRNGIWGQWVSLAQEHGFTDIETFSFDLHVPYSHEAWRGRIRASAGITALDEPNTKAFDHELEKLLRLEFSDPVQAHHRVWALVATIGAK